MTNPKDNFGRRKPGFHLVPPVALLALGDAMADGLRPREGLPNGYGPFNWRETAVDSNVYYSAAMRHLMCWLDGEDNDPESGVNNLAAVMANCAILLDAISLGMLLDNRPRITGQARLYITQRSRSNDNKTA